MTVKCWICNTEIDGATEADVAQLLDRHLAKECAEPRGAFSATGLSR
jgi:hypothetical protein